MPEDVVGSTMGFGLFAFRDVSQDMSLVFGRSSLAEHAVVLCRQGALSSNDHGFEWKPSVKLSHSDILTYIVCTIRFVARAPHMHV